MRHKQLQNRNPRISYRLWQWPNSEMELRRPLRRLEPLHQTSPTNPLLPEPKHQGVPLPRRRHRTLLSLLAARR
ncbi:hypothetical protein Ahy_A05g021884 isoform C [Arachis hypogaea]|uniref:Uncharacterized protein n=1 Tax=Arachis hypogaea TaxID=3818 RepID=A0A445CYT8_ARAHY|nr:hypothetical protein Ahy_A05g021884 isoform C [Arachis hypogaea]